ncbi:MAG: glycosyltransferase family 2 protein [Solobacterium sp.]|nr:glycosyltransferase family 2 protein [Solobacterium sp.]
MILSIVIPVWNGEKYIAEAIRSALSLKLPGEIKELEILVVDDGSEDASAQIAGSFPEVKVLRYSHRNTAAARNAGIRASRGEFLFFLDADDILEEDAAMNLLKPFLADPSVMVTIGLTKDFISPELAPDEKQKLLPRTEPYEGCIAGCVMTRRQVLLENGAGLFDETLTSGEGVDWLLKLRQSGNEIRKVPATTSRRRLHLTNTGRRAAGEEMKNYAAILRKMRRIKKDGEK